MTAGRSGRRAAGRGFTLVEVLVAVAIVAVALAAGSRAAGSVVDTSQRLSDVVLAQWCADNQLTELRLTHTFPDLGTQTFSCQQAGQSFQGTIKSQATPNPGFRRVDATIKDASGHGLLTLSTVTGNL